MDQRLDDPVLIHQRIGVSRDTRGKRWGVGLGGAGLLRLLQIGNPADLEQQPELVLAVP